MDSFLLCMFGPLRGDRIALNEESIVIGRDRSSDIHIPDLLLSRKHCMLQKEDDDYKIRDLQSRNGVFVNGIPAHVRVLNHGDVIKLGDSIFVFQTHEDQTAIADTPGADAFIHGHSTLTMKIEDASLLKSGSIPAMTLLVRVARMLSDAGDLSQFYHGLLDLVLEMLPCDRASAIDTNFSSIAFRSREADPKRHRHSKSVCNQVLQEKVAVLVSDLSPAGSATETDSVSILCVPFLRGTQVLSMLYMDSKDPLHRFQETHLQVATALSAITAPVLNHLQEMERIRLQNQELQQIGKSQFIGESPPISKVLQLISRVGPADTTVLIQGESGTGKELAAKAIHSNSSRRNGPFVAINCAAIPESLLESELFGYEKGAFTGAFTQKKGKIEMANGGTLLLDEIGELTPVMQAKLLRVLQERQFERLGGIQSIPVDIRVIAATNQDMEKSIADGKFRQDLYYRLNVVNMRMPPLRELGDDILLLSQYFISEFAAKIGRRVAGLSPEARECILRYDWPGNVRELQNAIERAVALGTSEWILVEDLPEALMETYAPPDSSEEYYQSALVNFKKEMVLKAFRGVKGNFAEAAARLGVHPNHLYRLVKNLNLKDQI